MKIGEVVLNYQRIKTSDRRHKERLKAFKDEHSSVCPDEANFTREDRCDYDCDECRYEDAKEFRMRK